MIVSVRPLFSPQPYTLALSKKLIPVSCARSITAYESSRPVTGPKFIVPRQMRLTSRPVRPRCVYSTESS